MNEIINTLFDASLWLIRAILTPFAYLLPDVSVSSDALTSAQSIVQMFNMVNSFFPVDTMIAVAQFLYLVLYGVVIYKFVRWGIAIITSIKI